MREYLPLRMLEVEAAANAVYAWAAERVLEHRLGGQDMGEALVDVTKALQLAGELEDQDRARGLSQGK